MASPSKEEQVLKLILEHSPLKEWHFTELTNKAKVTKAVANKWLKKYVEEGLLKKIKEKGRFPYFTVGKNNPTYQSQKRIHALRQLHESGLFAKLLTTNAKTIILFGSMAKGDWYKESDIDLFIFGNITLNKHQYEQKLNRHIELHTFEKKKHINTIKTGLLKNVIDGYVIKGSIQDIAEVNA